MGTAVFWASLAVAWFRSRQAVKYLRARHLPGQLALLL